MRLLVLYLRSRQIPVAVAAMIGCIGALWAVGRAVEELDPATLAGLGLVVGIAVSGPGLAGADIDLERTAAIPWPPRRALHIIILGVVTGVATLVAFSGNLDEPATQIARNAAGMSGLIALAAATFGVDRAWVVPLVWTLLAWMLQGAAWSGPAPALHGMLTWMAQSSDSWPAALAAGFLAAVGTISYARWGPR
jgi:hypothetical protein